MQVEADPELEFGGGGFIVSSCEKFPSTIVCYRRHCRMGGPCLPAPWMQAGARKKGAPVGSKEFYRILQYSKNVISLSIPIPLQ